MANKRKCVTLRGQKQRMQAVCPHCHRPKTLEYREYKSGQRKTRVLYGVSDLTTKSK